MYQPVIGLECHAQLDTSSKLFCACPIEGALESNSRICPICLGHPGTLPTLNSKAIHLGIVAGLATSCEIHDVSVFERKQYFYPDLSKGYQISQYLRPLATNGKITIHTNGTPKAIRINRIHLEEDAGKSTHLHGRTRVDYNRSGTPLAEIVTEPDIRTSEEAVAYLKTLHRILVTAGVTKGDMERGHFRCDANISVHRPGEPWGTRTEVKNLNSFRNVAKAIDYEIQRQIEVLHQGGAVVQETRTWKNNRTESMRGKEGAADYRYFPDPDLPPLVVTSQDRIKARATLPAVPLDEWLYRRDEQERAAFVERHQLDDYVAGVLLSNTELLQFFEQSIAEGGNSREIANWMQGEFARFINEGKELSESAITPLQLVKLQDLVDRNVISYRGAKEAFSELWRNGGDPESVCRELKLLSVQDEDEFRTIVKEAIQNNPKQVEKFIGGNKRLLGFFIGELMKATQGRADPKLANRIVTEELDRLTG